MFKSLLLIAATSLSFNCFAVNPYSDCGIGAALFPNTHVAAVTSNVIWDLGTTAVISATASEDTCSGSAVQTAQLIHDKYELLETDIMLGNGENFDALASSLGCQVSPRLRASIQSDMRKILSASTYVGSTRIEKSSNLYDALQANKMLELACSSIS